MTDGTEDPRLPLAGVMGWPVAHSKSPVLFDHWFREMGVPGRYVPLAVAPGDFAEVYRALPKAGFQGVNVTIPHKEQALALADTRTATAETIGAANMIVFDPNRGIVADNTDAFGFLESLRLGAPGWRGAEGPAVVLGAGGAARAVVHALLGAGVPEIRLANRTRDKAEALAAGRAGVAIVDWKARAEALDGAALVVNTTSLGMAGHAALDLALNALPRGAAVLDIVYTPLETPLLAAARAHGCVGVDGLGMLLHQARPAFKAWFGADPQVSEGLRDACLGVAA